MGYRQLPLESYREKLLSQGRAGRGLLLILSYLYRTAISLRNYLYDKKILSSKKLTIPLISIGNIAAGGTGKTPLVELLAKECSSFAEVAIISRGYKAKRVFAPFRVKEKGVAEESGDEPLWLARKLPTAQVWVDRRRKRAAELAIDEKAQLIILDDGMQHRQLQRDLEIVVVNGEKSLEKQFFLPYGLLRDSPSRLKAAHLIVAINQGDPLESIEKQLNRYAPLIIMEVKPLLSLENRSVAAFCAIAHPQRFIRSIQQAGGRVTSTLFKPDHDHFTLEELALFLDQSKAETLICTEKDRVKLPPDPPFPLITLPIELKIVSGAEEWHKLLSQIKQKVSDARRRD